MEGDLADSKCNRANQVNCTLTKVSRSSKKKGGPGEGKEKGGIEEIVPATVH
jgi:hypothetical protein